MAYWSYIRILKELCTKTATRLLIWVCVDCNKNTNFCIAKMFKTREITADAILEVFSYCRISGTKKTKNIKNVAHLRQTDKCCIDDH